MYKARHITNFDEVITGFGRLGDSFANEYFDVKPDIFTTAKGITNATVPMGAVFVRDGIYDAFRRWLQRSNRIFHGYTIQVIRSPAQPVWLR